MAELTTDPAERAAYLTFAVIGAGPTGVEMAGQVAELAHEALPREYRSVTTTEAAILLIKAGPEVLAAFRAQATALHEAPAAADGRGRLAEYRGASHGPFQCHGQGPRRRPAYPGPDEDLGGRGASLPLAAMLAEATGADTDRAGRITVRPDCSLPGHPEVFAVGDMVRLNDLQAVAQPAMQEGAYVGRLIGARLTGKGGTQPFAYRDKGSMATIGHLSAVADSYGMKFTGVGGLHDVGLGSHALPDRLG